MANQMSEEQIYEEARSRVKAKKDFWRHFTAWAIVNVLLIIVWTLSGFGSGYPWFLWPLCVWGAFVLIHYLRVFHFDRRSNRAAVEKEAEKIRKEQG